MIERLLPATVAVGETWTDLAEPLHPQEEAVIARAVDKRRTEFRSVRGCARTALARLGLDRPPMVPGPGGAPTWPAGLVGSMTHCTGYRAAVVARTECVTGLGIDAEPHAGLPDGVLEVICTPDERDQLARLARDRPGICWDRVMFSAKESVYKTWYPLVGVWLGFEDARLTIDPGAGTLTADLLRAGLRPHGRPLTTLHGRWLVEGELAVTAVVLPAPPRRDGAPPPVHA
jgi:4'-phosphopantetheinyl transferase EntD